MTNPLLWSLLERNRQQLIAYGVRLGATRVQAENCLQDSSAAIWERELQGTQFEPEGDPERSTMAYLYTCMRNCVIKTCIGSRARDCREAEIGAAQKLWESATPSRPMREEERRQAIEKAKSQLSRMQRCAVEMRYEDDFTYSEVAAAFNIEISTVQKHLERATQKLRSLLNDA